MDQVSTLTEPELVTSGGRRAQTIVGVAMLIIAIVYLRWQGRIWWCAAGDLSPIALHVDSHNSQHLFDVYSFSHIQHGLVFYGLMWLFRKRMPLGWRFIAAMAIEIGWEMMENSPFIINRYRTATISLGYTGDSIANSIGDAISCAVGFYLAAKMRWWWTLVVYVAIELTMIWLIRDSLGLNILMLVSPIEAVRKWQAGG
jgi:hypothetical protein